MYKGHSHSRPLYEAGPSFIGIVAESLMDIPCS